MHHFAVNGVLVISMIFLLIGIVGGSFAFLDIRLPIVTSRWLRILSFFLGIGLLCASATFFFATEVPALTDPGQSYDPSSFPDPTNNSSNSSSYGNYCCDGWGSYMCQLLSPGPTGSGCTCVDQLGFAWPGSICQ